MSKIYIICNRHDENLLSLYQEALYLDHQVIPFYHRTYDESFEKLYNAITENDYVMVLHTTFGSEHLHKLVDRIKCKKFLNANAFKQTNIGNKLFQQNMVSQTNQSITIPTYTKQNNQGLTTPFIAKPFDGSCGAGIFLLEDKSLIKDAPDNYIFQPYVVNDGDWRTVVVGGKAISAIKRLGQIGRSTNNIATGSFAIKETDRTTLDTIYPLAESVSKCMGFDYVGIDIIKDVNTNRYYFLESNERPTFETSQILTGTNIAKSIIQEITK